MESIKIRNESLPIWKKFSDIPKCLWSLDGIGFIASCWGEPICADKITVLKQRIQYAKACIEVPDDFKFPESIQMNVGFDIATIQIEYFWKPSVCAKCQSFGHLRRNCAARIKKIWNQKQTEGKSAEMFFDASLQGEAEGVLVALQGMGESETVRQNRKPQ